MIHTNQSSAGAGARVLFVGDAKSYHVSKWMRYFGAEGREVHALSTGEASVDGVVVHYVRNWFDGTLFRHLYYPWYLFRAWRIMRRVRPDVVHIMQVNLFAFLATLAGARPTIVTPFGGDILVRPKQSRFVAWFVRFVLRRCERIVCDATHVLPTLVELGAGGKPVDIVYFGVDTTRFKPARPSGEWAERLGVNPLEPVVISLRHLLPIYDIPTLIRAIPAVLRRVPTAQFIVVGRGSEEPAVKELASTLGVGQHIRWVSWVEGSELPGLLSLATAYVSTSLSDAGLASSTAEAMACGVVPIVTDFGDNRLWVQPGETGLLFPLGDEVALAAAICEVSTDDTARARMATRAVEMIDQRYNWQREMDRMGQLYDVTARGRD